MKYNCVRTLGVSSAMLLCYVLGAVTVNTPIEKFLIVALVSATAYPLFDTLLQLVSTGTKKRFKRWLRNRKKTLYIR